ncbi:CheR family methyltransferase [Halobacillus aidingensis]|uniref:protein-glutamate O-methyltransferase n=1 Tax=Halobacillus aidingensis TaxID=240303 RepID=A0A1H0NP77_HALAD|nr:protein-glutamate O-methyltransferase CheR [Halobacillus aidingensis]SDO94348.1 chemotaxis protein methyltransferase CheR [Halobacillus aidingensis]
MSQDYIQFIEKVHRKTGIDLSQYKEAQMKRRLTSLREKRGYHNFKSYYNALENDSSLSDELLDRMTINVSEFYRNRKRFEVLEQKVIPYLLQQKKKLRIWSAACSTGEEPYTLAMILSRYIPLQQVEILATDLDVNALRKAEQALYHERSLKEVSPDILRKYFRKEGSSYRVIDEIRNSVTFKKHNLLADRYQKDFDLIVCRNVMIYFTEEAKKSIYKNFSHSLVDGGIFFVGSTEQIFSPQTHGFEIFDTFFYRKWQK